MADGEPRDGESSGGSAVDAAHFRQVLGHFCTGVTVIAALRGNEPIGFTAQSFTSVSLHPPLVTVCPARASGTWPHIRAGGSFCASVLAEDQEAIGRRFATRGLGPERFDGVGWHPSPATGSPILDGAVAWVDCRLQAEHEAGDHMIAVAEVVGVGVGVEQGAPLPPLLFYRGGYGRFAI